MKQLTSEEYKKVLLELIVKVDAICRENGIWYSFAYGTLLGAVRHQGFIPWDDDLDIVMPREDYEKLKNYVAAHPELGLSFIDIRNRPDTIYVCGKLCDTRTVIRESSFRTVEGCGAFVDVLPLDTLPDDEKERGRFKAHARYLAKLVQHSAKLKPGKPTGLKHAILLYSAFVYSHCFSTSRLIERLDAYCSKYQGKQTGYCGVPYFISYFRKEWFNELSEYPFEGRMLLGPKDYDDVLTASYIQYRDLPPPEERVNHLIECYWKE